jgi:drug/metabolite transporter (DMT)-like permease
MNPKAPPTPPVSPAAVLLFAVLAISWAGPLVRFTEAPALAVALWRMLFTMAFLGVILLFRPESRRALARLERRDLGPALGAGALLALHFWSWIASIHYTSIASSVVLVSTQPLWVALLSAFFLREHPGRREWVGMGVAVLGAAWIGWGDWALGPDALFGDALALGAGFLAAAYYTIGRSIRQRLDLWSYVTVVYGAATLVLLVAVLLSPEVPLVAGYGTGDWTVFFLLAAGPMMIGHTGVNYALRYVRAYIANLAVLGEPIGATLIAWALPRIGEAPGVNTLIGGGFILLGVWIALTVRKAEGVEKP